MGKVYASFLDLDERESSLVIVLLYLMPATNSFINDLVPYVTNWIYSPRPSLSKDLMPCSSHSSRDTQKSSLVFMISARTAPPRNTICFRRGGSSILILNFCIFNTVVRLEPIGLADEEFTDI